MKEMLESQRQALPIKTEVPARRASPEDDTIASLRTEIKALHGISEFLLVWFGLGCPRELCFFLFLWSLSGLSPVTLWSLIFPLRITFQAMLLDTHTADLMANTTLYGHGPCIPFHSARFFIFINQLADELK